MSLLQVPSLIVLLLTGLGDPSAAPTGDAATPTSVDDVADTRPSPIADWFERARYCADEPDAVGECELPTEALDWSGDMGLPVAWNPTTQRLAVLRGDGYSDCIERFVVEIVDRRGRRVGARALFRGQCARRDDDRREEAAGKLWSWVSGLEARGFVALRLARDADALHVETDASGAHLLHRGAAGRVQRLAHVDLEPECDGPDDAETGEPAFCWTPELHSTSMAALGNNHLLLVGFIRSGSCHVADEGWATIVRRP